MSTTSLGLLTILAIFLGPVVALRLQKYLDRRQEAHRRRVEIFRTLMMFRATPLAVQYVQALNIIDVEFYSDKKSDRDVRDAWRVLLDHFYDLAQAKTDQSERTRELTANLLSAMGKCVGYEFDMVMLKKGVYYPKFLGNVELEQHKLRQLFLELFEGKRRLPVGVFEERFPALVEHAEELPEKR